MQFNEVIGQMNKLILVVTILAGAAPAFAGDVGVSITVDQPGLYGRIDIGNAPPPQLINAQPVLVAPSDLRGAGADLSARSARLCAELAPPLP